MIIVPHGSIYYDGKPVGVFDQLTIREEQRNQYPISIIGMPNSTAMVEGFPTPPSFHFVRMLIKGPEPDARRFPGIWEPPGAGAIFGGYRFTSSVQYATVYEDVTGFLAKCRNCNQYAFDHAGRKCLFEPTTFTAY